MPLWLLALALAVSSVCAPPGPPPATPPVLGGDVARAKLSDLDRALLTDARYTVGSAGEVVSPAPESKTLSAPEVEAVLAGLRETQRQAALAELERIQDDFVKLRKLSPADRLNAQVTLAKNWDLLPPEARESFNALLEQNAVPPVTGPDLRWVERVKGAWDKALSGTLPEAVAGPNADGGRLIPPPLLGSTLLSKAELKSRLARVEAAEGSDPATGKLAPYPEDIKRGLREIMRYADPNDSAAVLRVLEKRHPIITRSDADMFAQADGVAHTPSPGDKGGDAYYRLAMPNSFVWTKPPNDPSSKDYVRVPFVEAKYYTELGLPVPPLDAYDPKAKPVKTKTYPDGVQMDYADGSYRWNPTPEAQASIMLHEILHLDTGSEGGGAHAFTNEMRSFYAMDRLTYNRDLAMGTTDRRGYKNDNPFLTDPLTYRSKILGVYMSDEVAEVTPDRVLVASQLAQDQRALAASGPEFETLRAAEIERRLDSVRRTRESMIKDMQSQGLLSAAQAQDGLRSLDQKMKELRASQKDWDYRAFLEDERMRLLRDQVTTVVDVGRDIEYHRAQGLPYVPPAGGKK
jgi:hypothetical protein